MTAIVDQDTKHLVKIKANDLVEVDGLPRLIELLEPGFGPQGLATKRAIDAAEVAKAYEATASAKRRVRIYSDAGFVPNSYRYDCTIQWVEATRKSDGDWVWSLGWGSAKRPNGRANKAVVQ